LKNGHVATLTSRNGLPCDLVQWLMEDDASVFWLSTPCGLVRVARSELDAWFADMDTGKESKRMGGATVFDNSDGVEIRTTAGGYNPHVAKSPDGKLWFGTLQGVSVIDPLHLPFNKIPPPVHIEQITADGQIYDARSSAIGLVHLPPRIRDLQIDYTALSLVAPEKVVFRYKLEGMDANWQEAGTRRQAFYNNLPPGNYRFRVSASNNSGVWNEAGASVDFAVAPAYHQTTWFRLSVVAVVLALLAALYQLRLRQVARQFNVRMEERVNERTRIARDLHDTLLQSFQAALMRFHTVSYLLPHRPDEAQKTLESVIEQARDAIIEGRNAVQGLRATTGITIELAQAMRALAEELAADHAGGNCPDCRVQVEGTPRSLAPLLHDDIHRIASEALRNAFKHAQAKRIEVEVRYGLRQLRLRVRDNGKGMDPKLLTEGGRPGHFGLAGMHERAKLVGGKLAVRSGLSTGTECDLSIPASVAYAKTPVARRSASSGPGV
jgi:signal transduction histidine kinase